MWALKGLARPARELACRPVTGKRHQGISPGGEAHADLHLAKRAQVDRGGRGRDVSGGGTQPEGDRLVKAPLKSPGDERRQGQCGCLKASGFQRVLRPGDPSDVGGEEDVIWILAWQTGWWFGDRNLDRECTWTNRFSV